ncbi:MAG TPA: tRNA pseudouridine(38-40) synthase TruA [Acidimicrobiales bacterium]
MSLFDVEPVDPRLEVGTARVRLLVAYDGAAYRGFWPNAGVATVGGVLIVAIEQVLNTPITLTCAGRTDAGVHAWGQVVTFDAPAAGLDLTALQVSLNKICGPTIVIREASAVDPGFDARSSARSRTYRYAVLNRPYPDPFLRFTAWHVPEPLDLRAMVLACDPLIGSHDFSSFCRRPKVFEDQEPASLTRRVEDARWVELDDDLLRFEITANAFCHQMVRSIVGLLVDVGRGRSRAGDVLGLIRAQDRANIPTPAPPEGLCLWSVAY